MAFEEVSDLSCETTVALGGFNKKSGKPNPTQIEGYFLGSKDTQNKKSKTGISKLHILKTSKGEVGVWGKTDLDRKMTVVPVGHLIRITQTGTRETPNGNMYTYSVGVDKEKKIEVNTSLLTNSQEAEVEDDMPTQYADAEETAEENTFEEEETVEAAPVKSAPPKQPAKLPDIDRQKRVQEMLNKHRKVSA